MVEKSKYRPDKKTAPEQQNFEQHTFTKPGVVSAKNKNANAYKRTEPSQSLFVLSLLVDSLLPYIFLWFVLPMDHFTTGGYVSEPRQLAE